MASTLVSRKAAVSNVRLVLASQSPRRREIFDLMGLAGCYEVIVSGFAEDLPKSQYVGDGGPARYAQDNAVCKARAVAEPAFEEKVDANPVFVVGSDTIVDLDGAILEKPADAEEARVMLRQLSGRSHTVHSGVAIFSSLSGVASPAVTFAESTNVCFGELSEADIDAYVASGEPMDKAGSYGIQVLWHTAWCLPDACNAAAWNLLCCCCAFLPALCLLGLSLMLCSVRMAQGLGGQFVDRIEGCYFNVMGFPMRRFSTEFSRLLDET